MFLFCFRNRTVTISFNKIRIIRRISKLKSSNNKRQKLFTVNILVFSILLRFKKKLTKL